MTLSPSAGATAHDLIAFQASNYLIIEEFVTVELPYTYQDFDLPGPIRRTGTLYLDPDTAPPEAYLVDKKAVGTHQVFPYDGYEPSGPTLTVLQDLRWKSTAPDSINAAPASEIDQGWHQFETDMVTTFSLAPFAQGWTVTTTHNGVPFAQPHNAPASVAHLTVPTNIPAGGSVVAVLTGTVLLSAADVAAGTKTFALGLYDSDAGTDPLLAGVSITVPTANGVGGMYTPFYNTTVLWNSNQIVVGAFGSSDEREADVYFTTPDETNSETRQVFAE
jgi:hypothetical protein